MLYKTTLIVSFFFLVSKTLIGQDFETKFRDLYSANDTNAQAVLLKEWELAKPKDPELFIAYFNHYVNLSRREIVTMDSFSKSRNAFAITDSVTGKTVGFMNSSIQYVPAILQKGFDKINQGIALHPLRLDMRFGKIYMLGQSENYPEFTKIILQTIEYGNTIKSAWLWKEDKPLDDAVNFFLKSMQDYNYTIYDTEDDNLLPYMRQISEAVLKYHPNHLESLANIAMTYLIIGDNDKALPYLLKAEKINPKDMVILNNLAEAYKRKNDKVKAKVYYEKMIQYGKPDEVEYAKEKLKAL